MTYDKFYVIKETLEHDNKVHVWCWEYSMIIILTNPEINITINFMSTYEYYKMQR